MLRTALWKRFAGQELVENGENSFGIVTKKKLFSVNLPGKYCKLAHS